MFLAISVRRHYSSRIRNQENHLSKSKTINKCLTNNFFLLEVIKGEIILRNFKFSCVLFSF